MRYSLLQQCRTTRATVQGLVMIIKALQYTESKQDTTESTIRAHNLHSDKPNGSINRWGLSFSLAKNSRRT